MSGQDAGEMFATAIAEVVRLTQSGERISAAVRSLETPVALLALVAEADEELAPEIAAAVQNLADATDALLRAFEFVTARYEVRILALTMPLQEGD